MIEGSGSRRPKNIEIDMKDKKFMRTAANAKGYVYFFSFSFDKNAVNKKLRWVRGFKSRFKGQNYHKKGLPSSM
jgi:hypothetical protein